MSFRVGAYIWSACAAGWLALGIHSGVPVCYAVAMACAAGAWVWIGLIPLDKDDE